jgi:anti-anti-sigma factor
MNADIAEPFTTRLTLSPPLAYELADARSRLTAAAQRSGPSAIIHVGGAVDAFNEDVWRRLIGETAKAVDSPGLFVIDVNAVSFLGCCAFDALADEAQRCLGRRVALRLVSREPPRLSRVIHACRFGGLLPVYATASAALAAPVQHPRDM